MPPRREIAVFAIVLGALIGGFLGESLFGGKVLSPADVLFVSASFRDLKGPDYDPENLLLSDPVLQFQPWLEFNRRMILQGRLPLWNDLAGCGTPHLANSQSAVFDPFHLIAYLGSLPAALPWIAAARLWVAGLGMFVLTRSWGLGGWGRWFAGLTFPFCGFLIVWLLYPVTAAGIWMPWLFWASDWVLERPESRRVGFLGLVVGCVVLAGHIQTSALVLLAAGFYVAWRIVPRIRGHLDRLAWWTFGIGLGLAIAAVTIVPLGFYLARSPVWADRAREKPSPWRVSRPRLFDAICTAVPYAFGSQQRGHPNLARALGVHNLNESAGGFAGLATLIWLAPRAWRVRRVEERVRFLAALTALGFLAGFGFPPVTNVLRAIPVLDVMDHRRLLLWLAFGLVILGGVGLDHLAEPRPQRTWPALWAVAALWVCLGAFLVQHAGPSLRSRAVEHYTRAARSTLGADLSVYLRRAERQVSQTLEHVPGQLRLSAAELSALAALAILARNGRLSWSLARFALLGLTVVELLAFGHGLNPSIEPADDRAVPALIARLRNEVGQSGRIIGLGEELLPNTAMRYGLADARNYDSVELTRNLDWFEPLYEPDPRGRSSRRTITWEGVLRARQRLREASVVAVVGATPPPSSLTAHSTRVGDVWLARLESEPLIATADREMPTSAQVDNGRILVNIECSRETTLIVRQTYDSGWRATVDGQPASVLPHLGTFLSVRVPGGSHRVSLIYDPPEVRAACAVSLGAIAVTVFALTGFRPIRSTRFPREGLGVLQAVGLESDCDLHRKSWPAYH